MHFFQSIYEKIKQKMEEERPDEMEMAKKEITRRKKEGM